MWTCIHFVLGKWWSPFSSKHPFMIFIAISSKYFSYIYFLPILWFQVIEKSLNFFSVQQLRFHIEYFPTLWPNHEFSVWRDMNGICITKWRSTGSVYENTGKSSIGAVFVSSSSLLSVKPGSLHMLLRKHVTIKLKPDPWVFFWNNIWLDDFTWLLPPSNFTLFWCKVLTFHNRVRNRD